MNRAINGLIDNPQNNLKMFQNGNMVFNEYSSDRKSLNRIMKCLFPDVTCVEKRKILTINLIRKVLLKDFSTCCDSIANICSPLESDENVHLRSCRQNDLPATKLPEKCILSSILRAQLYVKDNFENMEMLDASLDYNNERNDEMIQNYRVGSTALDCSVMITLRRFNVDETFNINR
jgi:hypothetical protein